MTQFTVHPSQVDAAVRRVPLGFARQFVDEDLWRLREGWFGGPAVGDLVLQFGARSSLEAILLEQGNPSVQIVIVEPDPGLRHAARSALSSNAKVFATFAEALDKLRGLRIDHVRVDIASFDLKILQILLRDCNVIDLRGEFVGDLIDPLALYRLSRDRCESFLWRGPGDAGVFGADSGPIDIEVSVVVPAYKVPAELENCLKTLANQTLQKLEIIVVDDGSPDNTGEVADGWAARYPGRIRVIHKTNGGCASARMAGIAAARGEYIGFVDGDDWVDVNMYEELYRAAALTASDMSQCGYAEAFSDGSVVVQDEAPAGNGPFGLTGIVANPRNLLTLRPTIWRRIYRRAFIASNALEFPAHIKRFDDLPFQFEALALGNRMAVVPEPYYFYRQGRPGQDIAVRDDRLFVHFDIFEWLTNRVRHWSDEFVESQLIKVQLNTHQWALSRIEQTFAATYLARAKRQLAGNRQHVRVADLLRIGHRTGPEAFRFTMSVVFYHTLRRLGLRRPPGAGYPRAQPKNA